MDLITQILWILFAFIFAGWLSLLSYWFYKTSKSWEIFGKGSQNKDLVSTLEKILKDIDKERERVDKILKVIAVLEEQNLNNIQKVGLVRFNPFSGTGGNQSFSLALLDGEDNGLVISSLHSRETTRIYAKPIKAGKPGNFELSDEEKQAIKGAKKLNDQK